MRKIFLQLLVVILFCSLTGCAPNTVAIGENGESAIPGDWIGNDADGNYMMDITVSYNGGNIFFNSYSYPCGEKTSFVMPPHPVKTPITNGSFELTIDYSDLNPKVIIAGKFTDISHIEGTWETFKYQNIYLGTVCPAAKGTWKGTPK